MTFQSMRIFSIMTAFVLMAFARPAFAGWDYDVQGSTALSFDDNITSTQNNEKDDIIANLRVGLGATYTGKTTKVDARTNIIQNIFFDNTNFNNNAQDVNVTLDQEVSRYDRFQITDSFVHAEQVQNFDDALESASGRYAYYRNRLRFHYERDVSSQFRVGAHYNNEVYSVDRADLADSVENGTGLRLDWIQSSATTFLLAYRFLNRDYSSGEDINIHTILGGVEHFFTTHFSVEANMGSAFYDAANGGSEGNLHANLAAAFQFNDGDKLELRLSNTTQPNQSNSEAFESWRVTLSLAQRLLERLTFRAAVFYGESEFDSSNDQDEVTGIDSRLQYDVSRHVKAFTAYNFTQKTSNSSANEYDKNLVTIGMEFLF